MTLRFLVPFAGRSPRELTDRGRQVLARRVERFGLLDAGEPPEGADLALIGQAWDAPRAPFFASFDDREATLSALRSVEPDFDMGLRARANRILAGRYDLLGHRDLHYPMPVEWWLDAVSGVRAPSRHWSRLNYLDPAISGDHKVIWELGRHQQLVTLAQAWWCLGDTRAAEGLERLLSSWLDANVPKQGVHWASSLEIALRGVAWVWILALVGEALPEPLRRRMLIHLALGARHVARYLSTWFSPNTHLTGEALGLFFIGMTCPHFPEASRWRELGARILLDWIERHVRPDGTYVEQSTWYHRYTVDFYLHFLILGERHGRKVRNRIGPPLRSALDFLAWITRPDGTMPLVGDDDGGRLLFLDEQTAHHTRSPLAVGAVLFGDGTMAAAAGRPSTELVWLLGPAGLDAFRELAASPPAATARVFPDGGLAVIRSGWDREASVLTIDAGPHGFMNGGHAHADALSIDLAVRGQPLLVDPGTCTYTVDRDARDRFRRTSSHSAAEVDDHPSAIPAGPFGWATRAEARLDAWQAGPQAALFSGTHDGYSSLGVVYRRSVVFLAPDVWIVRDEVTGQEEHCLTVHWQCGPDVQVRRNERGVVLLPAAGGPVVLRVAEDDGAWSTCTGEVSHAYGVSVPAPHCTYSRRAAGSFSVTTIVGPADAIEHVAEIGDGGSLRSVEVVWRGRRGVLTSADASKPPWIETDARIAWVERRGEAASLVEFAGGTAVRVGDQLFQAHSNSVTSISATTSPR